ncbi:MAG: ParB/RepB/Spo0J family partition protein [Chloroflexi bacterium]|nr:ParB/RepB/Spo0J family partition protein [Chloroflexota bacterium]
MSSRHALGRGLDSLISPADGDRAEPPAETQAAARTAIPIAAIQPNPDQPRSYVDPAGLEELASSIREHGVLQPIIVRREAEAGYVLVAGERRWRAARLAGLSEIPAIITDVASEGLLAVALVENLQREDLSPLEEAHAYARLIDRTGMTQQRLAARVGKSRAAITNALRLLQLPDPIRLSLAAREISEGHARAILGADGEEQQLQIWEQVKRRGLSVRDTERAVQALRPTKPTGRAKTRKPGDDLAQERLQSALGTKVRVERGRKGGRIVVQWYDDEQLEAIVTALVATAAAIEERSPAPDSIAV